MKKTIILIVIFGLLTFIITYPLFLNFNKMIPGFESSDEPYGSLWSMWWLHFSKVNNLSPNICKMIAFPVGMDFSKSIIKYPLWDFLNSQMSISFNGIIAYNLNAIFSFILSGIFVYYFVYYLLYNKFAAFISALIFSFCPYHLVRSWQHIGLSHIQWMPLYLFSLFRLLLKKDTINLLLALASIYLVFSFDYYYAYFMVVVTILMFLYLISYRFKETLKSKKQIQFNVIFEGIFHICIILLFSGVIISPMVLKILKTPPVIYKFAWTMSHRPFKDLFTQSARPLSYFLPATVHPIFGKFTENFIGTSLYGDSFTEHTLYLGWIPFVLAFIAFRRWKNHRRLLVNKENFYIGFFVFLAIAAWLFSQPPWWKVGSIKIYLPSFFMYKILPMFRAYCRFGIIVMLAISVLAGFGLKFILERFKTQKLKIAITALFCGLVLFEFWNWPSFRVIDVSRSPAVYYWLKEQPGDFAIAEYPLDAYSPNEMYKFYQTKHEKKIINGTMPGTYANKFAQNIIKLSDLNTAGVLKWMRVKYVLVHQEGYLQTDSIEDKEELARIPRNLGLKFVRTFPSQECLQKNIMCVQKTGPIDIYEVVAVAAEPKIKKE